MLKVVYVFVGDSDESYRELLNHSHPNGNEKALSWTEMLGSSKSSSTAKSPQKSVYMPAGNVCIAGAYLIKLVLFCFVIYVC